MIMAKEKSIRELLRDADELEAVKRNERLVDDTILLRHENIIIVSKEAGDRLRKLISENDT